MTETEIDDLLKWALQIYFYTDGRIYLLFANEYESKAAYDSVYDFFKGQPIFLKIYRKEETLKLFFLNQKEQFVHTDEVEYDKNNFEDDFVNRNGKVTIQFFMIYNSYNTREHRPWPVAMGPMIEQQHRRLDIRGFEVIS